MKSCDQEARSGDQSRCRLVIFDGDDTLWETMPLYTSAKQRFYRALERCGLSAPEGRSEFDKIDAANVSGLGFARERFPRSMIDTYRLLCKQHGRTPVSHEEECIREIGESVFEAPVRPLKDAKTVLEALRGSFRLVLLTKGDHDVQYRRIAESGLREFFDHIEIVDHKTAQSIVDVVVRCGADVKSTWLVGNSLRSDIAPAIAAGVQAIWIPYKTWLYEDEVEADVRAVVQCRGLKDLLELLKK